jgi:hypothetical protein
MRPCACCPTSRGRAEAKRQEFQSQKPSAKASAKVLSILPQAASLYHEQIAKGLDGDAREAGKARVVLREMFGRINRRRDGAMLFAEYTLKPEALLQVVGSKCAGTDYIDVRICQSSGKNLSSSALARYATPLVPPVPGL